jgi:hypothetical protein
MMEEMYCPYCDAVFLPAQLADLSFTRCAHCKLSVLVTWHAGRASIPVPPKPAAWPAGFVVEETAAAEPPAAGPYRTGSPPPGRPGLTITWRTSGTWARCYLIVFNALWWGVLISFVTSGKPAIWIGLYALVGCALLWLLAGAWLNSTRIHADSESLSRSIRPLSLTSDVVLPIETIAQLFTRRVETSGSEGDPRITYVLYARDRSDRDHEIISLDRPGQAWWLEARIEQHLGIADRPVEGEHLPQA